MGAEAETLTKNNKGVWLSKSRTCVLVIEKADLFTLLGGNLMNGSLVSHGGFGSSLLVGCSRSVYLLDEQSSRCWYAEFVSLIKLQEGMSIVIDASRVEYVHLWLVERLQKLGRVIANRYGGTLRVCNAQPHVRSVFGLAPEICVENDVLRPRMSVVRSETVKRRPLKLVA